MGAEECKPTTRAGAIGVKVPSWGVDAPRVGAREGKWWCLGKGQGEGKEKKAKGGGGGKEEEEGEVGRKRASASASEGEVRQQL
ncbi:hypothetical protein N7509_011007 [Penicillium cosmopolitanum]|uniref:Uncharacterized protein n=1 Tax=Penicillium cosmopolitanum TaxID=1131564 RepID=A0A9W9VS94_9EURO|nr:uncharacterized protein N7509_011007 [Penicillium cosmopolitanum]KAJ5388466.1 hypothetical protein N7509_011007 [Penicillium cosmopolitanum]